MEKKALLPAPEVTAGKNQAAPAEVPTDREAPRVPDTSEQKKPVASEPPLTLESGKHYTVRLDLVGQVRMLNLSEIEVFRDDKNLALHSEASMSPGPPERGAEILTDGRTTGSAEGGDIAHSFWQVGPWAEVRLPKTDRIDKIVLWNRSPDGEPVASWLVPFKVSIVEKGGRIVWEQLVREARVQTHDQAAALRLTIAVHAGIWGDFREIDKTYHNLNPQNRIPNTQNQQQTAA